MDGDTIEQAVEALYRAMLAHDIPGLAALLSDDGLYIHSTGLVESKAAFLDGVRDGLYEYQLVRPVSTRIWRSGDLAAVYSVLDFMGGKRGLAHKPVTLLTTLIWERRDSAWRMTSRHATRVP